MNGFLCEISLPICFNIVLLLVTRRVSLVEQELSTLPEQLSLSPVFSGVRVTRSLVLCVMLCRSLFVLLSSFFWPLCCLYLRILITSLVSPNSSCMFYETVARNQYVIFNKILLFLAMIRNPR
jgi:hypothetical protein